MERLNCPRKSPGLLKKQSSHGDEASPLFCLSTAFTSDDEQLLVPPHVSQLAALPRLSDWQDDGVPCILTQDPRASKQVCGGSIFIRSFHPLCSAADRARSTMSNSNP
jgi:hypothetical protein